MGMIWKVASFNVNGIRARLSITLDWLRSAQPDVLCLQEIKCQEKDFPFDPFREAGYEVNLRGQKSFNGVAILSKNRPEQLIGEFGDGGPEDEARLLAALVDGVWVVNTYVPQGRHPDDPAFEKKLGFLLRLKNWFEARFSPLQPIVWVGDINVAPEALDIFDPKRMEGQAGFHPAERQALQAVRQWGFTDLFRRHHPQDRQFTFWDYRLPSSFKRNLGWRIDHIAATPPLRQACLECNVDCAPRCLDRPSDHTPVWAEFDLEKLPV